MECSEGNNWNSDKDGFDIPQYLALIPCQYKYGDGNNGSQYGTEFGEYLPGPTLTGVLRPAEIIRHHRQTL